MPITKPENTCQKAGERALFWARPVLSLRRLFASRAQVWRLGVWLALALLVTTGMAAAVNRFARELNSDLQAESPKKKPSQVANSDAGSTAWWDPGTLSPNDTQTAPPETSGGPQRTPPQNWSAGASAFSNDRGNQISSGASLNNRLPSSGSNFSTGTIANSRSSAPSLGAGGAAGTLLRGPGSIRHAEMSSNHSGKGSSQDSAQKSSGGRSLVPVDREYRLGSGKLSSNKEGEFIDSSSSQEAYVILGLSRSSSVSLKGDKFSDKFAGSGSELQFSLSGDLKQVPVDNLAGALHTSMATIPEPSSAAMLATGFAGLALARRRRQGPDEVSPIA